MSDTTIKDDELISKLFEIASSEDTELSITLDMPKLINFITEYGIQERIDVLKGFRRRDFKLDSVYEAHILNQILELTALKEQETK